MSSRFLEPAAAAIALAAALLPAARAMPERSSALRVTTMTMIESNGESDIVGTDVPPQGPSVGDRLTVKGRLSDPSGKRRIGMAVWRCVVIDLAANTRSCELIHSLAEGTITADGTLYEHTSWAGITGGTGKYRGARGVVRLVGTNGPSTTETLYLISGREATAAPKPPAEPAHVGYPSSIVALGDSGSTGYNSGPPNRDAPANAWATGSNPEVQSHYLRLLAANPRIRGRSTSYARDGDRVRDLPRQARLVGSKAAYVTVDVGGNDVCALAETPPALFRSQLRTGLTALSKAAPNARILVLGLGSAAHFFEVVATIPDARAAVSDGGPCDPLFDPEGKANPQRVAEIEGKLQAANALLETGCAAFVHCRYDGNSTAGLPTEPADLSRDWGHASVRGLARRADVTWKATFDFTDAVAPVSRLVRAGRVCTLSATDDRGLAGLEYRLGKGVWIRYSKPVTVPKGTTFTWRAVDLAGNSEAARTLKGF